jgi:F-box and WD-40 domain protein CDC4
MDGTVRIWSLRTGECLHTLTGHTSLVGLLGLSPSTLVSAAADSTLRVWDPDTGELRCTLAAHVGAITCFQHDEFKVLSGSDGTLKMWDIRDGTVVRDLLTGVLGVWQVVFEGRWCMAASNRNEATMIDVWDFGTEIDDDWVGEVPGGMYDDETSDEGESDDEDDQADVDAMDEDFVTMMSDPGMEMRQTEDDYLEVPSPQEPDKEDDEMGPLESAGPSRRPPRSRRTPSMASRNWSGPSTRPLIPPSGPRHAIPRGLPSNDETPTRPRIRNGLPVQRKQG